MIIGDPYKFALILQKIGAWNVNSTFCNGILFFCVDGELFPKSIDTATLSTEKVFWENKLERIVVNHELFDLLIYEAFVTICNLVYPTDLDISNDYRFDFSPQTLCQANSDCHIFVVSNGEKVRIMASKLDYNIEKSVHEFTNVSIRETVITIDEFCNIFSQAIGYVNEV